MLGGAAAAQPLAARAQQGSRPVRIGFLSGGAGPNPNIHGFQHGLRQLGYVEGQNLVLIYRWAAAQRTRILDLARELLDLNVDVLASHTTEAIFDVGTDPLTGKRRIRYTSFKGTKREAEIELARLVAQNAAGEGVDPSKATLAEFIERWDRDWSRPRPVCVSSRRMTKHGRRNVTISPWLVAELRAHRARQQERRLSLGMGRAPDDSLVFAQWDGSTRSPHWLTQKFALAMAALKIDAMLHGLRHTHVSRRIRIGRADDQPPDRPCLTGDHAPRIRTPVFEHRRPHRRDHGGDVCQGA